MSHGLPRVWGIVAVATFFVVIGCGDDELRLDTPQAKHTKEQAEVLLRDGEFLSRAGAAENPPGKIERVECTGGEDETPRGDFKCKAITDTDVQVECEGFVTNGRVASSGCAPARLRSEPEPR